MFGIVAKAAQLIGNMGLRYVFFRLGFELKKRSGILKKLFPTNPKIKAYYTLQQWRAETSSFFFKTKDDVDIEMPASKDLENQYKKISSHTFTFFSNLDYNLGADFDWITNPDTGHTYSKNTHWNDINDYSQTAGDIKYVWEPSRFSHLYTFIRYDKHTGHDCSAQVFQEIESWIKHNDINQGPNFKCSQEISLRILNWTFALNYYKNSANLNEELFEKIQHYVYWQVEHVYNNINFSRIAVRNNHAITETLFLYIAGTMYPQFPNAARWKKDGKRWFEQEIAYQLYEDGTFLQFSMNYHRVVIQLLTWAIRLAELNDDKFDSVVYERAKKSIRFLTACMDSKTGWLPNYGANDGALFFKLNDNNFRDYRPQLEALSYALGLGWDGECFEDAKWYNLKPTSIGTSFTVKNGYNDFNVGGYYLYRTAASLTFVRCGNHKDRPSQADNLHLDIWHNGSNILHDAGSYKYNSFAADIKYFMGSQSHNTVMLDDYDQMQKGSRFIWYNWTQCKNVTINETDDYYYFEGTISAFRQIDNRIEHSRCITIYKSEPKWIIEDVVLNKPNNMKLRQLWHTRYHQLIKFQAAVEDGRTLIPVKTNGYVSDLYGKKEVCDEITFTTTSNKIKTIITINA